MVTQHSADRDGQSLIPFGAAPSDRQRLRSSNERLLERLRQGPATNIELATICGMRVSARIHDLRTAGYSIKTERVVGGAWLNTLEGHDGR